LQHRKVIGSYYKVSCCCYVVYIIIIIIIIIIIYVFNIAFTCVTITWFIIVVI